MDQPRRLPRGSRVNRALRLGFPKFRRGWSTRRGVEEGLYRQLEKEVSKLREERDILRKAAKYFAEETRW